MTNIGITDRIVRAILELVLIVAPFLPFGVSFFAAWGAWKFAIVVVGVVLAGTAAMRFCPVYSIFGLSTCPVARH